MKNICKGIVLLLLLLSIGIAEAQEVKQAHEPRVFILLRHAEQEKNLSVDPPLSVKGQSQAVAFAALLKDQPLAAVYTTPYKRTQETANIIAQDRSFKAEYYEPNKGAELANKLKAVKDLAGAVVFVGHSNTIPHIANSLLGSEIVKPIGEGEFGQMFIITIAASGEASLLRLRLPAEMPIIKQAPLKN